MLTSSLILYRRQPMTRDEVGTLLGQTMGYVAGTVATFAVGAYVGQDVPMGLSLVLFLASFAVLFGINRVVERSTDLALLLLYGFGLLLGLSLAPALQEYATSDSDALWQAGGATALFTCGFGAAGYATRRDLSRYTRTLLWALVGLILFGVILIFVQIPGGSAIYTFAGLAIFAGLTAFDFQRLRLNKDIRSAPLLAVSIFLDILNVFLLFLSPFGGE